MKIYVVYGFDIGPHGLIGASESEESITELIEQYKKDRAGLQPYVQVREIELDTICIPCRRLI